MHILVLEAVARLTFAIICAAYPIVPLFIYLDAVRQKIGKSTNEKSGFLKNWCAGDWAAFSIFLGPFGMLGYIIKRKELIWKAKLNPVALSPAHITAVLLLFAIISLFWLSQAIYPIMLAQRSALDEIERYKLLPFAEKGDAAAQFRVGELSTDKAEALKWYRKSAEQGYAKAEFAVGASYPFVWDKSGKEIGDPESFNWFRKAAEQGNYDGQVALSAHYQYGLGTPKDLIKAYMWADIASKQNIDFQEDIMHTPIDVTFRDLTPLLTSAQIAEAKKLSDEWIRTHPK